MEISNKACLLLLSFVDWFIYYIESDVDNCGDYLKEEVRALETRKKFDREKEPEQRLERIRCFGALIVRMRELLAHSEDNASNNILRESSEIQ